MQEKRIWFCARCLSEPEIGSWWAKNPGRMIMKEQWKKRNGRIPMYNMHMRFYTLKILFAIFKKLC